MGTWLSFVTSGFAGPVCLAITVVGLVLSAIAWRKRGARAGIRGAAWSLLPTVAWLTHALGALGRMVSALVVFASGFVFSPETWVGVILAAVAAVLFLTSGGIPLLRWRRRRKGEVRGRAGRGENSADASVRPARERPAVQAPADDDLSDVKDILRRHGIS